MDTSCTHRARTMEKGGEMSSKVKKNMFSSIMVAVMFFSIFSCSSGVQEVDFESIKPDEKNIQRQLDSDAEKLRDWKPDEQARRILKLFHKANELSVSRDQAETDKLNEVLNTLHMATKSYLISSGRPRLEVLGLSLLADFEKEFDAICSAAGKVHGAALALLTGAPVPDGIKKQFQSFARAGGGFLVVAAANDLVTKSNDGTLKASPDARFFMRIAFKVYWSNALPQSVEPLDWILSPFERKWYEIWVAQKSKTAPLVRKLAALEYLSKNVKDYPAERVKGIILYKAKKYALSQKAFELALQKNPGDKKAKLFLAAAKKKMPN